MQGSTRGPGPAEGHDPAADEDGVQPVEGPANRADDAGARPAAAGADGAPSEDPDELAAELKFLREEVDLLRRRLETAPTRIRVLEERLLETKSQLQATQTQNGKLADTLRSAREQLNALKEETERLAAPPRTYGTFLGLRDDDVTADVMVAGRKLEVSIAPELEAELLAPGQEVRLN